MRMDYVNRIFGLDGKRAIVTGGNSGIGFGIAVSLASLGADVDILGRDQATLGEAETKLNELGSNGRAYRVDVSVKAEVDAFFDSYYDEFGHNLDILVANAGVTYTKRALDTSEGDIDAIMGINYKGALFCCQRASEAMIERKRGNIIIVTSVNAHYPLPPQAVYTGSKAALEALTQCLAVDLAKYGVRVNSLAPGAVVTKLGRNIAPRPSAPPPSNIRMPVPLGRAGLPEDMGDAVACLVTDAFRYMTGSTILVDGGLRLRYKPGRTRERGGAQDAK